MAKKKNSPSELVSNRKARHDFEILETFEAGIALVGTEIKSLRDHGGALQDAFVRIINGEAFLINSTIAPYRFGNVHNHEDRRQRKLLLHNREIAKLKKAQEEKGLTLVPLKIYLKNGYAKTLIAIARGKKLYDKRHALKEKDQKRSVEKALKGIDS